MHLPPLFPHNRATRWTTCWRPTSARCWPPWASSAIHAATASERLIGVRRRSWCVCCGLLVGRAAGGGPSRPSCGEWAAPPLPAPRAPSILMKTLHLPPVRMTTSEQSSCLLLRNGMWRAGFMCLLLDVLLCFNAQFRYHLLSFVKCSLVDYGLEWLCYMHPEALFMW